MASILITGGTGSFGNAATKRFLKDPSIERVIVFSRDEEKQHDMRYRYDDPKLSFIVGDVRDREAVDAAACDADYIFHAAALKHVPTGEYFPIEMVKTNILGTDNVLNAAEKNKVKKVVLLSTDKAVYPINAMGMSKALAEKLVGARARSCEHTTFLSVRYGNVMASRGSIIPLLVEHIKAGKPLPLTDPSMTRFLLSLDDAIDLVVTAIAKGEQGDLFIKKAPAATVGDLAQALLNIFGAKNAIEIVGTRAGEKKHESLATAFELARAEDLAEYWRIRDIVRYGYEQFYEQGVARELGADYTSENTKRLTVPETEALLRGLEYITHELAH